MTLTFLPDKPQIDLLSNAAQRVLRSDAFIQINVIAEQILSDGIGTVRGDPKRFAARRA